MTLKVYVVSDRYGDHGDEVVIAETPGKAKSHAFGLLTSLDFIDLSVRRAPEFDKYIETGGPTKRQLFEEHGWWWECGRCYAWTGVEDGGVWTEDGPMCPKCVTRQEGDSDA